MRAIFGIVLAIGMCIAGFAVYMAQGYVSANQQRLAQIEAERNQIVPTVQVVAAAGPLQYGRTLTPDDLQVVPYPRDFLPEGAFLTVEDVFPDGPEQPRVVLRQLDTLEVITAAKVTEPGKDAGLTQRLGRGMRAFAIQVDVTSGVSGFVRPGDKVDVYWSGAISDGRSFTRLIQSGIGIVAVDQTSDATISGATIARTVTVEVTPIQVAGLAQAQATGSLSLSLVGTGDDTVASSIEVDTRNLLGIEDRVVAAQVVPPTCSVRTRRGSEVADIPIPCTN